MKLNIQHDAKSHQFTVLVDEKMSTLDYEIDLQGKIVDYYSTFVPPELRGQRIAETLVKFAMEYAKANHYQVIPSCPYVQRFIERHPEYQTLVKQ